MSDLKRLVPKWVMTIQGGPSVVHRLFIGAFEFGAAVFMHQKWSAYTDEHVTRFFGSEAEAKAWVEARLYGDEE